MFIEAPSSGLVESLYISHHIWLRNWLLRKLGCSQNAADLTQDTFLRVLSKDQLPEEIQEPRAYLTTIAHGLIVDHIRKRDLERAYNDAISSLPTDTLPSPETQLILLETLNRIDQLLDGLNSKTRLAFLMSRLEGLSYPDIAKKLNISLSSVEKYMATAILHCYKIRNSN